MLLLPLLSLSALWGFVLNLTMGDAQSLLRANTLYDTIGVTSTDLGLQLQAERVRSAEALTTRELTEVLGGQRARTDKSVTDFRQAVTDAGGAVGDDLRRPLDTLNMALDRLALIRSDIDNGISSRLDGLTEYNRVLDALFQLYDHLITVSDLEIFQQASSLQAMGMAREYIAREHALAIGALSDGRLTPQETAAFTEYAASRKFLHSRGLAGLDVTLRRPYEQVFATEPFLTFATMESRVIKIGAPPADADGWHRAVDQLTGRLDDLGKSSSDTLAARTSQAATGTVVEIAIAGGLGLIAVLASIIISVRFGRRLAGELAGLRAAAVELSGRRLPDIVARLRRGEDVDVRKEAKAIKVSGSAEITDVARAFGYVQRTAVTAAVGQAALRHGIGQVFLNLARRKQGLLHRQLALLDGMQRRTHDPDRLEELFRLDHLTTRMRRHAESLIVLSGAAPGRAWRKPVPVIDIVRAAVSEIEDYTRVSVETMPAGAIDGTAAADVTHLLAELVENATIYSPPDTAVQVRGDMVSNGYAIEVEDRGSGCRPTSTRGSTRCSPRPRVRPGRQRPARPVRGRHAGPAPRDQGAAAPLAVRRHHGHRAGAARAGDRAVRAGGGRRRRQGRAAEPYEEEGARGRELRHPRGAAQAGTAGEPGPAAQGDPGGARAGAGTRAGGTLSRRGTRPVLRLPAGDPTRQRRSLPGGAHE
ncbi:nitrate- and nitrite sensing domain-containing protein [Nonomuraea rubra]|uniref:nitrate- and nitrite sensing domain-containing protein n=1 Tax=Nonomuraea rubra TaxID=46180 RepID=UPI003615F2F2